MSNLETRIKDIEDKLDGLDVRVCNEAAERTDSNSKDSRTIKESINDQIDEMKERDKRKNNLIIFNVEESNSEDIDVRKQHDMDEITELLSSVGLGVSSEVINPIRLGPKISDSKWPRPLRVSVDSESTKWNILKQSKNLTCQGKERFQTVFIKRDMTPMEREKDLLLRNQLKEKRKISEEKGEQIKWIIRSGKIIAQK